MACAMPDRAGYLAPGIESGGTARHFLDGTEM
jgi:hypothetical protein